MIERELCKRCGHKWIRRQDARPKQCPECRSPYWDEDRQAVISEPQYFGDPTPLVTRELVTLDELKRRYPLIEVRGDVRIFDPNHPDMADEVLNVESALDFSNREVGKYAGRVATVEIDDQPFQRATPNYSVEMDAAIPVAASGKGVGNTSVGNPTPMCQYRELDRDANEWVYCSLEAHSPKVKHVPGKRESA